jgi:hypothetical protein
VITRQLRAAKCSKLPTFSSHIQFLPFQYCYTQCKQKFVRFVCSSLGTCVKHFLLNFRHFAAYCSDHSSNSSRIRTQDSILLYFTLIFRNNDSKVRQKQVYQKIFEQLMLFCTCQWKYCTVYQSFKCHVQ